MKPIIMVGSTVVTLALIFYSIAVISGLRKKKVTAKFLTFLLLGVFLDISATAMMIVGSSKSGITLHGVLGYSALLGMFIDAILMVRLKMHQGYGVSIPKGVHQYTAVAYSWWIIAYVTGTIIVMIR